MVLVGLSGAGKSAVAPAVAALLGWRCADVDEEIARQAGTSIADLFRRLGEADFRTREARLTAALCSLPEIVVAPGAGWAARPGALDGLPAGTAVVWLRIAPEEALRRLRGTTEERPLLAGPDPLSALTDLAARRSQHYERADLVIDVDGRSVDEIARTIVEWLKRSTS